MCSAITGQCIFSHCCSCAAASDCAPSAPKQLHEQLKLTLFFLLSATGEMSGWDWTAKSMMHFMVVLTSAASEAAVCASSLHVPAEAICASSRTKSRRSSFVPIEPILSLFHNRSLFRSGAEIRRVSLLVVAYHFLVSSAAGNFVHFVCSLFAGNIPLFIIGI